MLSAGGKVKLSGSRPWFKHWPAGVPQTIDYPRIPLDQVLRDTAAKYPERTAVTYFDHQMSYAELDAESDAFAAALQEMGVVKGDRVALFLPNVPQFVVAFFGTLKARAVVTSVNPLHKEREVAHQLMDAGAETIVALDSLISIVEVASKRTRLRRAIVTGTKDYLGGTPAFEPRGDLRKQSFMNLLRNHASRRPVKSPLDPLEDLAVLQYTGGTTGTPKGAMLTHWNMVTNMFMFARWIKGSEKGETFLIVIPLSHIYGMTTSMNVSILLGGKMVLFPRFDPVATLESIQVQRVSVFCGVPTMYAMLISHPKLGEYDLGSIRACISGSAPLPLRVMEKFAMITGGVVVEGYGLTEASPGTHCNPLDPSFATIREGSIGLPFPDTDAMVVDVESGTKELSPGEVGELIVAGPQIMKGYWNNPEETGLVIRKGWLYTGDIARMDEDGYFFIVDRKKDMIKYKDYSVYPRELEEILYEHPAVRLCAVIGKPRPVVGEIPKAFVVLKEGANATAQEMMEFVNSKVAPYKAVREVEFRKELPMTSVDKVFKRALQEEEWSKPHSEG